MDVFERRVLDALPNTVYTIDLGGNITSVNRSWSRFAESNGAPELAPEQAVRGRSIWRSISDLAAREEIERAMTLLRTGRADHVTWEFPCNSPTEERVFLMQLSPLREERAISGFVFSNIDITPSHRSREALIDVGLALSRTIELDRVFHELSQQIRRAIPNEGFVIALVDGNTGELHVAHRAGYEGDAGGGGANLERRLRPRWTEALSSGRVLMDHTTGGLELTAPMTGTEGMLGAMTLLADGIESPQRLDEAERVLATIAAQSAVAIERAALVRRVEEKRRLEAIGEVAAGIAHELRNPLFGISSSAQLLRFRAREDPVIDRNVGRILREVERLNGMVTDLLEYGRPRPLALAPGDPDAIWDEVLEGNRGLLEARSLTLVRQRAKHRAQWAIDEERIRQVMLNILMNAVDAAPPGSELTLASSVLPNGAWRCTLHNEGPSIPPEVLPRVFEIFFSTKQDGTGIGLALCRRIIDEHGGAISIESAPDRGTTVTITIPYALD